MGINRNHRFVTSEKCVEEEDNVFLSLYVYKYSLHPISYGVSFYRESSFWLDSIYILLLPFSSLEVNCCFRQREYGHTDLARLHRPDGFGASFSLLEMSVSFFTGHILPHWFCGKKKNGSGGSFPFSSGRSPAWASCMSVHWVSCSLATLKLQILLRHEEPQHLAALLFAFLLLKLQ